MFFCYKLVLGLLLIIGVIADYDTTSLNDIQGIQTDHDVSAYAFWPEGNVPFYINPNHYDQEQTKKIMSTLAMFAFRTCVKFLPVLVAPSSNQHVLVIENPEGRRSCDTGKPHPRSGPHTINLGYECLESPQIDMTIMRALGFPFEHNRRIRDIYIDVQHENIETDKLELYTMDGNLPAALRALPYDVNSVMHFDERDSTKNGHRTFIFKNSETKQNRNGLTDLDLRKIEIVYGPECLKRERLEKVEMCKNYQRKKRSLDPIKSLRVNPEITPPTTENNVNPDIKHENVETQDTDNVTNVLLPINEELIAQLDIDKEVKELNQILLKITRKAVLNARWKYCNTSEEYAHKSNNETNQGADLTSVIDNVITTIKSDVDNAAANATMFCNQPFSIENYQRYVSNCHQANCYHKRYYPTKTGNVIHHTQHRPTHKFSTKHNGGITVVGRGIPYNRRSGNGNENDTVTSNDNLKREKRNADTTPAMTTANNVQARNVTTKIKKDIRVQRRKLIPSSDTDEDEDNIAVIRLGVEVQDKSNEDITTTTKKSKKHRKVRTQKDDSIVTNGNRIHRVLQRDSADAQNDDEFEATKKNFKDVINKEVGLDKKVLEPPKVVDLTKENEVFYAERRWPDNIVRYVLSNDTKYDVEDLRTRLDEVATILKERTCTSIVEVPLDQAEGFQDYLVLDTSPDYVTGRVGGRQHFGSIELLEGGQHRQHTAMMVMAMLGFYFEVSRHDRDEYIVVHNRHIRPDKLHHFEKIRDGMTLPIPYDYTSATHPAWQFWRKVGRKGIATVATLKKTDPDGTVMKSLGQNEQLLSDLDIVKINSVYGIACFNEKKRQI